MLWLIFDNVSSMGFPKESDIHRTANEEVSDIGITNALNNRCAHQQIIKEWNVELQERTSKFRKQANAIADWDRKILRNRDVLLKLELLKLRALEEEEKFHYSGVDSPSTMIYTAIDTFYLTDEQLQETPSRKDGIDEATETTLRIYGCDLIQESGILLKVPQQVMATGQVLFHRFYCKKSFVRFNVKRVAASCVWLASKLEENPRRARHVINVFHRMECRRENLPLEHMDAFSKKYSELKMDLIRSERHLLKEMAFICHVEHPHKFISNYLATLETPPELRQEAWNLANDSLRTTLCVRFKSAVVACGVVYAAARRFHVPLPENPPWWKAFDADKTGIDEVCRVLAHLYTLPKARYIPVCKEGGSFTMSNRSWDSPSQPVPKEGPSSGAPMLDDTNTSKVSPAAVNPDSKDVLIKAGSGRLHDSTKSDDDTQSIQVEGDIKDEPAPKNKEHRIGTSRERSRDREREREREKDKYRGRDRDRGRDSDRERDDFERDREKVKDRSHRSKDRGHAEKVKHHPSRDRDYHGSSYSSREKERHRHQSYG
ncbi:cyclin-L1-1-like protein isoform X1 [Tanacetum coccineum]